MSKYGYFCGPYFRLFGLNPAVFIANTGKYGPEKTPYLDTFYTVYFMLVIYAWAIFVGKNCVDYDRDRGIWVFSDSGKTRETTLEKHVVHEKDY